MENMPNFEQTVDGTNISEDEQQHSLDDISMGQYATNSLRDYIENSELNDKSEKQSSEKFIDSVPDFCLPESCFSINENGEKQLTPEAEKALSRVKGIYLEKWITSEDDDGYNGLYFQLLLRTDSGRSEYSNDDIVYEYYFDTDYEERKRWGEDTKLKGAYRIYGDSAHIQSIFNVKADKNLMDSDMGRFSQDFDAIELSNINDKNDVRVEAIRSALNNYIEDEKILDGSPLLINRRISANLKGEIGEPWTDCKWQKYPDAEAHLTYRIPFGGDGIARGEVKSESGKIYEFSIKYNHQYGTELLSIASQESLNEARKEYGHKISSFAKEIDLPFHVAKGIYDENLEIEEGKRIADIIKEAGSPEQIKNLKHELQECGIARRKGALTAILTPEIVASEQDDIDDNTTSGRLYKKILSMTQKELIALADFLVNKIGNNEQ